MSVHEEVITKVKGPAVALDALEQALSALPKEWPKEWPNDEPMARPDKVKREGGTLVFMYEGDARTFSLGTAVHSRLHRLFEPLPLLTGTCTSIKDYWVFEAKIVGGKVGALKFIGEESNEGAFVPVSKGATLP
jgi:hypothetical protein